MADYYSRTYSLRTTPTSNMVEYMAEECRDEFVISDNKTSYLFLETSLRRSLESLRLILEGKSLLLFGSAGTTRPFKPSPATPYPANAPIQPSYILSKYRDIPHL